MSPASAFTSLVLGNKNVIGNSVLRAISGVISLHSALERAVAVNVFTNESRAYLFRSPHRPAGIRVAYNPRAQRPEASLMAPTLVRGCLTAWHATVPEYILYTT